LTKYSNYPGEYDLSTHLPTRIIAAKATSFLFVGTHVEISNILGCPVLRGGGKPETFFERGDAATPVSFAHVDFLDKESIAYCYIKYEYFDELLGDNNMPSQRDLQPTVNPRCRTDLDHFLV
jgi:hypothetical protein